MNKSILIGRVVKDPVLSYTNSNIPYVRFTLAVNRTFSKDGEREADFIQCIAWRKQAENMSRFVRKGSLIGVDGRIQTGSYDDKDGIRKYTTDVVCDSVQFLEHKKQSEPNEFDVIAQQGRAIRETMPSVNVSEEDLPF